MVDSNLKVKLAQAEVLSSRSPGGFANVKNMNTRMDSKGCLVGLEMDDQRIRGEVFTSSLRRRAQHSLSTKMNRGAEAVLERLERCVRSVVDEAELQLENIAGIGLGVSGLIDRKTGCWLKPVRPGWERRDLREHLTSKLGIPAWVDNSGNFAGLGSLALELGGAPGRVLAVFSGNGTTGTLLEDGLPHADPTLPYEQISHLVIDPNGPACCCGKRGCLEVLVGGVAAIRGMQDGIARGQSLLLADKEIISLEDWQKAVKKGESLAVEITRQSARHLGEAMAKWIPLWHPQQVIVGGALWSAAAKIMLPEMLSTIEQRVGVVTSKTVSITVSQLGPSACTTGAAYYAMQQLKAGGLSPIPPLGRSLGARSITASAPADLGCSSNPPALGAP